MVMGKIDSEFKNFAIQIAFSNKLWLRAKACL